MNFDFMLYSGGSSSNNLIREALLDSSQNESIKSYLRKFIDNEIMYANWPNLPNYKIENNQSEDLVLVHCNIPVYLSDFNPDQLRTVPCGLGIIKSRLWKLKREVDIQKKAKESYCGCG